MRGGPCERESFDMQPLVAKSIRSLGLALAIALMSLVQIGGEAWVEIVHVLGCECCETDSQSGGCCSRESGGEATRVAARNEAGCACAVVPPDSPLQVASVPSDGDTSLRRHLAVSPEPSPVVGRPEPRSLQASRVDEPPPWALARASSASRPDRFLIGSGGERVSCLGSTLL